MDGRDSDEESFTFRIEQLQRERDELRKDIEQLCMQQAGPKYLAVATRMHFQRTAGLEQEIEILKKNLAGLARDKQNLQEELSEAYRIKTQLADLHSAEVLKNKEAEKQVKFFQSCVAAAFSERDRSLMEAEKAKEQEEAKSQKLTDSENRLAELQSMHDDEKKVSSALQMELMELKEQKNSCEKVINKFCEARERDSGISSGMIWQEKCSCLLNDPSEKWTFNTDNEASTLKYIASLKEELETLRKSMDMLQKNLRMGLQIEEHLKRTVRSLEKKQIILDNIIRTGLLGLRNFHSQQRFEVMKILEEEASQMELVLVEVHKRISQIHMDNELNFETLQRKDCDDIECRDVHITSDVESLVQDKKSGHHTESFISDRTLDASEALAQALQEKVGALLLLSQQEERHLLERDVNAALLKKIEELQRNLSQVTNEKVKVLVELAQLKSNFHGFKHHNFLDDGSGKSITVHEREGKLKNLFSRTSLRRWIGKDLSEYGTDIHGSTYESSPNTNNSYSSMEFARLKVENATFQERMTNMEHLTSTICRLHVSLFKAKEDVAMSTVAADSISEGLNNIIQEANNMKIALGSALPVSWSAGATDVAIAYKNLYEELSEKVDIVSVAGLEVTELLILAAQLLKEQLTEKSIGL